MKRPISHALACIMTLTFTPCAVSQVPVDTAFSYQGRIKSDGAVVNDLCDFEFTLWRDPNSFLPEDQIGPTVAATLDVTNGLFSTLLDFGSEFGADARWLQVRVRCPAGVGVFATVLPRQELTGTPFAFQALQAAGWVNNESNTVLLNGNLGIGTDTPLEKLHLLGDPAAIRIERPAIGAWVMAPTFSGSGGLNFSRLDETDMFLANDGNIGIGTTTPSALLDVNGEAYVDGRVGMGTGVDPEQRLTIRQFTDNLNGGLKILSEDGTNGFRLNVTNSGIRRIEADNVLAVNATTGAPVGIGTVTPEWALDVVGTIQAGQFLCSLGGEQFCGPSDERLKTDIASLDDSLTIVNALRAVRYRWRPELCDDPAHAERDRIGFLAQEVRKVLPELVVDLPDGTLALNYDGFIPIAVDAVSELSAQNREYEARLRAQEERIARLEAILLEQHDTGR